LGKHVNVDYINILKKLQKKWEVLWKKMKNNLQKKDQIWLLVPYLILFLQMNLSREMACSKSKFWKI
jgi:hypothetical protein